MRCYAPEVILSGPAGTGKSRACLEKMHAMAKQKDGFRGLIVRKTRESLTESALVTFEQHVVEPNHPILASGGQRRMRQSYRYPNGSEIVIGGLDKPSKIMSTEYDAAYVQEAIELSEDGWESITTRLRNHKLPYQQLMADTNPDRPTHWLKQRCDRRQTVLLESRHEDNPLLWDGRAWTPFGTDYISKLDNLTGPRKQRLRHGRWVQAEGVVYEGWDASLHVIDRIRIGPDWPRYWSIDFGFTDPFVCGFWATDHDGRLYLYREIVYTKRIVEDHARRILQVVGAWDSVKSAPVWHAGSEPRPCAIICDHDAEGRATLEKHLRMPTVAANKTLQPGLQAVMTRLKRADDEHKKPRLFVMRDGLDQRDPEMEEKKSPIGLAAEIDGYIWDEGAGRKKGEQPIDKDNHSMDMMRYMAAHLDLRRRVTAKPGVAYRGIGGG